MISCFLDLMRRKVRSFWGSMSRTVLLAFIASWWSKPAYCTVVELSNVVLMGIPENITVKGEVLLHNSDFRKKQPFYSKHNVMKYMDKVLSCPNVQKWDFTYLLCSCLQINWIQVKCCKELNSREIRDFSIKYSLSTLIITYDASAEANHWFQTTDFTAANLFLLLSFWLATWIVLVYFKHQSLINVLSIKYQFEPNTFCGWKCQIKNPVINSKLMLQ